MGLLPTSYLPSLNPNTIHNDQRHEKKADAAVDVEERHVHFGQIALVDQRMLEPQQARHQGHAGDRHRPRTVTGEIFFLI